MALYTRPAARNGLIALAFTHSDSMAAPFGGTRAFFGTNPIAIAFPRAGQEPACLDMATTSILPSIASSMRVAKGIRRLPVSPMMIAES